MAVRVFKDIVFDKTLDHKLDIYMPNNPVAPPTGYPVLYYIHGGAFHLGSKNSSKETCEAFAKNGYCVACPSYSLSSLSNDQLESILLIIALIMLSLAFTSGSVTQLIFMLIIMVIIMLVFVTIWIAVPREMIEHPAHLNDVANGFKWVTENIDKYSGNKDRIIVSGHSAGGHLAALLSTNTFYLEQIGVDPTKIKGVVAVSGVYSDKRLSETNIGNQLLTNAFGKKNTYYDAFPIYNVTEKTPPFLLINAGQDISLKAHSFDFYYTLRQAGVYAEIAYFESRNHFNIMSNLKEGQNNYSVMEKINSFVQDLEEHLSNQANINPVSVSPA